MDICIFVLELVGTFAFSVSGAMTGIKKNMDVFGVVILGLITAVGGGVLRDIILGITPPKTFRDPVYALVSSLTAAAAFLPFVRQRLMHSRRLFERMLFIMDALGLGIFTVMGIAAAYGQSDGYGVFLLVFVGVVTGTGGGVLRDMIAGDTPYIFVKDIYACASILGAAVCALLWKHTGSLPAMLAGTVLVVLLRCAAARFNWNLPRAKALDEQPPRL